MGSLCGTYQKLCGNFISNGIAILIKTGYFNSDNIKVVRLSGHIVGTFWHKGGWVFFDFDPQQPFFMIADSANKNGFASALDVHNNPKLVTRDQQYYYVNAAGKKIELCYLDRLSQYRSHFDSVTLLNAWFPDKPLSIPGAIVLPARASIISTCRTPYILSPASNTRLESALGISMDTAYSLLSGILGISKDSARTVLTEGGLSTIFTTQNWQPGFNGITPTTKIVLPATQDTVGTIAPATLSFPGYILGSSVSIYPGIFQVGQSPRLWKRAMPHTPLPIVADKDVHYLAEPNEYILPHPDRADTITLSYNPRVLDFGNGFKLGCSGTDSISIELFSNDSLVLQRTTYTIEKKNTKSFSQLITHK